MAAITAPPLFFTSRKIVKGYRTSYTVLKHSQLSYTFSFTRTRTQGRNLLHTPRMESGNLAKQMKEMAAAQRRWESQVREGKVQALTPKEAGYAVQLSDTILLDVRPSKEHRKAWVKDSAWIPIFDADKKLDLGTISKNISNFAMGGWWSGIPLMVYNDKFIRQVEEKINKDATIIVACQTGIRSLAACEQLYNAGYRNLYWIQGGFDAAEEGDLERSGPQPLKFAGLGGISEFLGWTDQQRYAAKKGGWGYRAMFLGRLVAFILLVDALFVGAQQLSRTMQEMKLYR